MRRKHYETVLYLCDFDGYSWLNLASAQNVEFPGQNLANKVREALDLPTLLQANPNVQLDIYVESYANAYIR